MAVIDVTAKTLLRPDREPFGEHEIDLRGPDEPSRELILAGFPDDYIDDEQDDIDLGQLGKHTPVDLWLSVISAPSLPETSLPSGHRKGRGVHVFLSPTDIKTGHAIPETFGMSGGPLVVPDQQGVLVGLATSRFALEGGFDQWCEPAVIGLKFLAESENARVAAAARRVLERCGVPRLERVST